MVVLRLQRSISFKEAVLSTTIKPLHYSLSF